MEALRCILISTVLVVVATTTASVPARAADTDESVEEALLRLENLNEDALFRPAPPAHEEQEVADRRRLAIARSVRTLEARLDTTLAVLEGDVLPLLSLARNVRHLGLRRRALNHYEHALLADRSHEYSRQILSERVGCAIELADSALVVAGTREILDREDAGDYGDVLGTALEFLLAAPRPGRAVRDLVDRCAELEDLRDAHCRIQIARARQLLDEDTTAHRLYEDLVRGHRDLDAHQTAIALMGLADSALASGRTSEAVRLYARYRDHDTGRLSAWATYQLGNLAASDGRLGDAVALLRSICEREDPTPWRERACTRLAQVRELEEIEAALRPYGRDLGGSEESR